MLPRAVRTADDGSVSWKRVPVPASKVLGNFRRAPSRASYLELARTLADDADVRPVWLAASEYVWLAPFIRCAPGACLRLNHGAGRGCFSGQACTYKHECLLCGSTATHGAFVLAACPMLNRLLNAADVESATVSELHTELSKAFHERFYQSSSASSSLVRVAD